MCGGSGVDSMNIITDMHGHIHSILRTYVFPMPPEIESLALFINKIMFGFINNAIEFFTGS